MKLDVLQRLGDGRLLQDMLKRQRVTREEVYAAVRSQGQAGLSTVEAVVLETDGSFSVIGESTSVGDADALRYVDTGATRVDGIDAT